MTPAVKEFRTVLICDNTWLIEQKTIYSQTLMYLLSGTEKSLLIDTGMPTRAPFGELVGSLTNLPVEAAVTHGHFDHIGNAELWPRVWLHERDAETAAAHADRNFLAEILAGELPPILFRLLRGIAEKLIEVKAPREYAHFGDGHVFNLGGREIEVIPTPGHTPGSVCFLDRARGLIFSGDSCCDWGILLHMPQSLGAETYMASAKRLLELQKAGAFARNYPGHHGYPADKDCPRMYAECAEGIVKGSIKPAYNRFKSRYEAKHEKILITLPHFL